MESIAYVIDDELNGTAALRLAERLASVPVDNLDTLVLSLREVMTVDASGVAVLVRLYSRLISLGKTLRLIEIPARIETTLRSVGLDSAFSKRTLKPPGVSLEGIAVRYLSDVPIRSAVTAEADRGPSIEDLVEAIARLDSATAVRLLRAAMQRLDIRASQIGLGGAAAAPEEHPAPAEPPSNARRQPGRTREAPAAHVDPSNSTIRRSPTPTGVTAENGWPRRAFATSPGGDPGRAAGPMPLSDDLEDLLSDYLEDDRETGPSSDAPTKRSNAPRSRARVATDTGS